jgi:hypothetical protein
MTSQPESIQTDYSATEWELLTELPDLVVIAATSAEADGARRTIDEGLAGDRGIEAGRRSDSPLVRAVAAELWTDEENADEPQPAAVEFNNRRQGLADTLAKARQVAALLAAKAAPADAAAYKGWLDGIAEQVCGAAKSGGFLGIGGEQVSSAEQRFLTDLRAALG